MPDIPDLLPLTVLAPLGFALAAAATLALRRVAGADRPVGGIGVFLGWSALMVFTGPQAVAGHFFLLAACLLLLAGGTAAEYFKVERFGLPLLALAGALGAALWGGAGTYNVYACAGAVFIVITTWKMTNAMRGETVGLSLAALLWFALAAAVTGGAADPALILLIAALMGFAPFCREKSGINLGAGGSLFLGLAVAWTALAFLSHGLHAETAAWILAYPLFDCAGTALRRALKRKNIFTGPGGHLHDVLLEAGYTPGRAAALCVRLGVIFGATGFTGACLEVPAKIMWAAWLACGLLMIALPLRTNKHA